ncbi:MAG: c-type cytochrome [Burkholderiaceae bacterium]
MRAKLPLLLLTLACPVVFAAQSVGSPRLNFVLHCAGCHAMDGSGNNAPGIPNLRGTIGNFLKVEGGRDYLAQVPGASQSPLSDQETAELLNWMLREFSAKELPATPKLYSADEVRQLRRRPLADVMKRRIEVTDKLLREVGVDLRSYP